MGTGNSVDAAQRPEASPRITRAHRHLAAPSAVVYRALIDPEAVRAWRFPDGMSIQVHEMDPRVGGRFRVSLTYDDPTAVGKTARNTDTYHGHFQELLEGRKVVEVLAFETGDPASGGEMKITYELSERDGGTTLVATHENVPPASGWKTTNWVGRWRSRSWRRWWNRPAGPAVPPEPARASKPTPFANAVPRPLPCRRLPPRPPSPPGRAGYRIGESSALACSRSFSAAGRCCQACSVMRRAWRRSSSNTSVICAANSRS